MSRAFVIKHRVQFCETDMAGVVHFANYFRMMEEVEVEFFRSLDLSVAMELSGVDIGWPRISVACDYFGPARFEDEIELQLTLVRIGEKSLSYEVQFVREATPIALGKATSVCCMMTADGFKAIAIPPQIKQKLEGRL